MFVDILWKDKTLAIPLALVLPVKADVDTDEAVRDWHYWTNMELVLNMLAEVSATDLSRETDPIGMDKTAKVAKQGGSVAKAAREQYEKQSGKNVVTSLNAKNLKALKEKKDGDET
jgi:ABC-type Zn uptake system ZnuABC Zn-binding protein ZnuA